MKQKTNVCVLASTSAGNCTVIWDDRVSILVDCGMGISYTEEALSSLGLSMNGICAVFITHCHGDHVKAATLKRLVDLGVAVYCNPKVAKALRKTHSILRKTGDSPFMLTKAKENCKGFSYASFSVPHDSKGGCFGYSFFLGHTETAHKVSIATDIGFVQLDHVAHFADSNIIIIESNHDVDMLKNSSRPQWLKDRILQTGHLSNDQCADFVAAVLAASKNKPRAVVLAHISQECNTNAHAKSRVREMLQLSDHGNIDVVETFKEKPSRVVSV